MAGGRFSLYDDDDDDIPPFVPGGFLSIISEERDPTPQPATTVAIDIDFPSHSTTPPEVYHISFPSSDNPIADIPVNHDHVSDFQEHETGRIISPAEQAQAMETLSIVSLREFDRTGDTEDLDQAVRFRTKAVSLSLENNLDPSLQTRSLAELARTLTTRFEHTWNPSDAELAAEHFTGALGTIPTNDPIFLVLTRDFAKLNLARYAYTDDLDHLHLAIDDSRKVLDSLPPDTSPPASVTNLAGKALLAQYERSPDNQSIETAVALLLQAVECTSVTSPERPKRICDYCNGLLARFKVEHEWYDLENAIQAQTHALNLLDSRSAAYPELVGSLATAFYLRYKHSARTKEDLNDAVENFNIAVDRTPSTNPDFPRLADLFGRLLVSKYRTERKLELLDDAVKLHQQATRLSKPNSRHYAKRLENLARAHSKRYRSHPHPRSSHIHSDKAEAQRAFMEALHTNPERREFISSELLKLFPEESHAIASGAYFSLTSPPNIPQNPNALALAPQLVGVDAEFIDKAPHTVLDSIATAQDMFQRLIHHGCPNLNTAINYNRLSETLVTGGSFGDIWRGQLLDQTDIAIKVWRLTSITNDGDKSLKRAMREIYNWSKLNHENIQTLMGVIMFQGRLGMVSKWMDNGNLREYIRNNKETTDRYQLCVQVARGVNYLHAKDTVHGDLKSCNILVSSEGILKLTDFDHSIMSDCSLAFSETTRVGGGTLRWMAPELVIEDSHQKNKQTDMYALGMTLLEIITGNLPYYPQCQRDAQVINKLYRKAPPERTNEFSRDKRGGRMWDLLVQCWDHDATARPEIGKFFDEVSGF